MALRLLSASSVSKITEGTESVAVDEDEVELTLRRLVDEFDDSTAE